ncbi:PAS domain S-box protein [Leptolyngbya sp. AN02str]|uniref:PAS domain S-box protein n=1 Tax=Leptolyngbya sp. AN02str TaxID=3423363 RepID=UPI003D31AADD
MSSAETPHDRGTPNGGNTGNSSSRLGASWSNLAHTMAQRIRQARDVTQMLHTTVGEVQRLLQGDRAFIYQFNAEGSGTIVVEAVSEPQWSLMEQTADDPGVYLSGLIAKEDQPYWAIADVATATLPQGHAEAFARLHVQATFISPIFSSEGLWGLLIVHHCQAARSWQPFEIEGLQLLTLHVGIAIDQAALIEQLQTAKAALQTDVTNRTRELETTNTQLCEEIQRYKQTAAELLEEQNQVRRLAAIVESSQNAIISLTVDGIITSWNPAAEALFGYPATEAIGQPFKMLIPPQHQPEAENIQARVNQGQRLETYETQRFTKDQRLIDVSITMSPVIDPDGHVIGTSKIIQDIRTRKQEERLRHQAEASLQASQHRFQSFMNHVPAATWIADAEGIINYANPAWLAFVGLTEQTAFGASLASLFPTEIAQEYLRNNQQVLDSGEVLEALESAVSMDGEPHTFLSRKFPIYDQQGHVAIGGIGIDVTARQKIEAALEESERRLQLALEGSGDGLWDWNLQTGEVFFNPRMCELLGFQPGELHPNAEIWEQISHPDDWPWVADRLQAHLADSSVPYQFDYRVRTQSGEWRWMTNYGKVVARNEQGQPLRMAGTHRDISDRKAAEALLQQQAATLRIFYETSPLMMGVVELSDHDIFHTFHNPATLAFFGVTPETLDHRWASEIGVPPEYIRQWMQYYHQSQASQQPVQFTYEHITPTHHAWLSVVVSHIGVAESGRSQFSYIVQDITANKQLESERQRADALELKAKEVSGELKLLEQILDVSFAGYWDWDIPNEYAYLSPGFKRMFGYETHELPNSPKVWEALLLPEDLLRVNEQLEQHFQSRGATRYYNEVRYRHKNGSIVWVICSGQVIEWDDAGNPLRMIGCHINITERKKTEAALQASETTNRALIQAVPDFLMRMRQDGVQLQIINPGNVHRLWPKNGAQLETASIFDILPADIAQERVHLAQQAIATGETQWQEYEFNDQGQIFYEEACITRLWDNEVLVVVRDITERKQAALELKWTKEQLELVLQASSEGFWDWNLLTHEIYFSPQWKAMLGYADHELENSLEMWASLIYEEDRAAALQLTEAYNSGKVDHFTTIQRFHHKDGSTVYVLSRALHLKDAAGRVIRMVGSHLDITENKRQELALQASEARYRNIIETAMEGVWMLDAEHRTTFVNPRMAALIGYDVEDMLGQPVFAFMTQANRDLAQAHLHHNHQSLSGQYEFEFERRDGSALWVLVSASPLLDAMGQYAGAIAMMTDISDRKRMEDERREAIERLRKSEAALAEAQAMVHLGNWELDVATQHITWSNEMFRMFGFDPHNPEPGYAEHFNYIHPDDRDHLQQVLERATREGMPYEIELRTLKKDGTLGYIEARGKARFNDQGQIEKLFGTALDITDRKVAEVALAISQKRFQNLIENSPDIIERFDLNLRHLYVSPVLTRLTGLSPDVFFGKTCQELDMDEGMITAWEAAAARLLETGQKQIIEFETPTLEGDRCFEMAIVPEYSAQGEIESILCISRDITERKQAEHIVRQSEERFRQIAETIQDVFFINTPDVQQVDYVSLAYETIWGRSRESLYQNPASWLESIHPDDRPWVTADLQQQIIGEPFQKEYRIIRPDGSIRWILSRTFPTFDEKGNVKSTIGLASDITERKQAEMALQKSEARFRILVTHAPVGIFQADDDGLCVYVNPRWLEMTGLSFADAIGNGWQQALHPDDREQVVMEWTQSTQLGRTFVLEYRFQRPDGTVTWVAGKAIAVHNEAGGIHRYFGTVMDITDRKCAEEALREQKEMFQAIVDHIPVMIALFNSQGSIELINPELEQTLGWSLEDWKQHDILVECYPDPAYRQMVLEHMLAATGAWKDLTTLNAQQQSLETSWANVPLSGERFLGIGQDISDRKRKEVALQQAREAAEAANLAKSMFLANMSHELRTPLNVILGFAQVMTHDPTLTADQLDDLYTIQRSGDHLLNLINDILDLSKIEAGHSTLKEVGFDLGALLQGLHSMMLERASSKGLQLTFDLAPDTPQFIIADEQKLRQVLLNLLSNAIKFTKQGHVTLRNTWQEAPTHACSRLHLHTHHSSTISQILPVAYTLQFEVIDTGIGIAPEEQDTIFEAFVQAEAGKKSTSGTGLGLAITRRLIDLMNGTIAVQSVPNVGSTFTVTITVCATDEVPITHEPGDRTVIGLAPGQPTYRILVVDDQRENRLLMVRLLTRIGLQVREATTGREAVQRWQDWQPDLIWMDIRMPGMNGYEATRQIRSMEQDKTTIILALTAQASQDDRALALAVGCNDYINKPFREETVFLKLSEHLGLDYEYAESERSHNSSTVDVSVIPPPPHPLLDTALLGQLSPTWLNQLEKATMHGNDRAIIELTAQLSPEFATLATQLTELADQFQFEQILNWIHHDFRDEVD